jgi:glycosyltransferase involved in cell wall biosynthesis
MARKTRILHITSSFGSGGVESYLLNFLNLADFDAFEHHLFVRSDDGPLREGYRKLPIETAKVKCTPKRFFYSLPFGVYYCKRHGIDIIHGHNYWFYRYAYFLSLLTGIPLITSNYGLGLWKKRRHLFFESLVFRRARVNIAISRAILEQEKSLMPPGRIHEEKFKLIYPIIDEAPLKNLDIYDREGIRKKLGITNDRPILTVVGRIERLKGHRIALDALERVNADGPKANLLLVGAMQDPLILRETDLRREYVKYVNYYDPIEEIWAVSDCFLIPSLSEGTPLVLVEYLALGKPVIASDISGNGELIRDGWNGFLFKTGDASDLAKKIDSVLESGSLSGIRANAREYYTRNLSPEKLVREIERCYRDRA